jgi:hypothetical protein
LCEKLVLFLVALKARETDERLLWYEVRSKIAQETRSLVKSPAHFVLSAFAKKQNVVRIGDA